MQDAKRIARNISVILFGGTFRAVLTPLFTILVARKLGATGFGQYSFALALAYILLIVGEMGLPKVVVRELAAHREDVGRYIGDLTLFRLLAGLASVGLVYLVLLVHSSSSDVRLPLFLMGVSFLIFTGLRRFFDSIFQAFEVMKYQALVDAVDVLITFGAGTALLYNGYGLMGISFAMMAGATISMAMDFIILTRKLGKPRFSFDLAFWKRMALGALPFGVIGLITFLFGYSDTVLVSLLKGDYDAGLFSSAHKVIWACAIIPATVMTAVFPFLARIRGSGSERHREVIRKVVKYLACLSLPFAGLLAFYAPQIISMLYGSEYRAAYPALWVLAAVPVFSFAYLPLIDLLNAHYKHRLSVIAILSAAAANLGLCMLLAPWLGFIGAAVSTLVAEALLLGMTLLFAWKHMQVHPRLLGNWKPLVATMAAAAACLPLRGGLSPALLMPTFILLYAAALLALRTFDGEDVRTLRAFLPLRRGSD